MADFWLQVQDGAQPRRVDLAPPGPVTIGREAGRMIRLDDKSVSRQHAELDWDSITGAWRLRDLRSTGGTRVNGEVVSPDGSGWVLRAGDRIEIQPFTLVMQQAGLAQETVMPGAADGEEAQQVRLAEVAGEETFQHRQLQALLAAGRNISMCGDDAGTRAELVRLAAGLTRSGSVAFVRSDADGSNAEVLEQVGEVRDRSGRLRVSRTMLRRARQEARPMEHDGTVQAGATMAVSLADVAVQRAVCIPVEFQGRHFGCLWLGDSGVRDQAELKELSGVALSLASTAAMHLGFLERERERERREREVLDREREGLEGTIEALVGLVDALDRYTAGHSNRVSTFAAMLARHAELGEAMVQLAERCGRVHDIGKIGVDRAVLKAARRLSAAEFEEIKRHPGIAYEQLRRIPSTQDIAPGALDHHERWDGKGYPNGKAGEQISLLGRILCVADCFDAMASERSYRPAMPIPEVLERIRADAGTHFDPELARRFLSIPLEELRRVFETDEPGKA